MALIDQNPYSIKRQPVLWGGVVVLALLVTYLAISRNQTPVPKHIGLSSGSIYYKGPMKGKGKNAQMATDNLNPDIAGDNP